MKQTELILNSDGSVYHLALKPQEIADTVITVGDPHRVGIVSQYFDSIQFKKEKREFVTHTGTLSGKPISVISTGIGTDNVDIVFNELHALKTMTGVDFTPYKFIRLGTSGAIREDIAIDSILASNSALGLDGLMHFYKDYSQDEVLQSLINQHSSLQKLPAPYWEPASVNLLDKFKGLYNLSGVTVTAAGFYGPQGRHVNSVPIAPNFIELLGSSDFRSNPITNLEMETAGIYGLANLLGHQSISVSAILANRVTGEFSANADKIVKSMLEKALDIIVS